MQKNSINDSILIIFLFLKFNYYIRKEIKIFKKKFVKYNKKKIEKNGKYLLGNILIISFLIYNLNKKRFSILSRNYLENFSCMKII